MTEAAAQAKQLDSVTDMVKETEIDASKAQEAMTALSTDKAGEESDAAKKAAALASVSISKDDVELIVSELEVTKEIAEKVLREVALVKQQQPKDGEVLEEALRKLVTSE